MSTKFNPSDEPWNFRNPTNLALLKRPMKYLTSLSYPMYPALKAVPKEQFLEVLVHPFWREPSHTVIVRAELLEKGMPIRYCSPTILKLSMEYLVGRAGKLHLVTVPVESATFGAQSYPHTLT